MKFNTPIDERAIWAIVKAGLGVDGPTAHALSMKIVKQLERTCETALKMDRVELRQELEAELEKKYADREEALKKREAAKGSMTRKELIKILKENVSGESGLNVQAAKLLTELEGFKASQQDLSVTVIDYKDAPNYYRTEIPDGI